MVIRTIDGFHQDDVGDWVAELSCLHDQHVRHQPPFRDRAWVLSESGRAARIGSDLDCPLCDRAELPEGLEAVRTVGPFDQATLPAGLQRDHRVADRTWAVLRVLDGCLVLSMATDPPTVRRLVAGDQQAIPPGISHFVCLEGEARLQVDFLTRRA
jgi:tellurite methyltransferase